MKKQKLTAKQKADARTVKKIMAEPVTLGRIDLEELRKNPNIVHDKLIDKMHEFLDKYGYGHIVKSFFWKDDGTFTAEVDIAPLPAPKITAVSQGVKNALED